ncbi:glycosyltransferase family 87 protein [Verrucomicrobiota bacterium]
MILLLYSRGRDLMNPENQWDFRSHYHAAKAFRNGLDPYGVEHANRFNPTPHEIPWEHSYPYHPYTLGYFATFALLPYDTAVVVYMLYGAALLVFLIALWRVVDFRRWASVTIFAILVLSAFDQTVFLGLRAGNTAFFEAAMVWLALAMFVTNRPWAFLCALAGIAFFKGTPLALSPLVLLLPGRWRNLLPLLVVDGVGILIWLSPLLYCPDLFHAYWGYAAGVHETGSVNPCALALIGDILAACGLPGGGLANAVYLSWVAVLGLCYLAVIRKADWDGKRGLLAMFSLLTYAIMVPRFKDYAYVQLIPVAHFVVSRNAGMLFFALFPFIARDLALPGVIASYGSFFSAVAFWAYLLWMVRGKARGCAVPDHAPGRRQMPGTACPQDAHFPSRRAAAEL